MTSAKTKWPTARRRKRSRVETIVDDVTTQIEGGVLAPGERLASHKELAGRYGVSHGVVARAISMLADDGLVVTKNRSGCFVAERRAAASRAEDTADSAVDQDSAVRHSTLYVSSHGPGQADFWRQALADFHAAQPHIHITLLSEADGSLAELSESRRLDLVEASPDVLRRIPGRFVNLPDPSLVAVDPGDLLPCVAEHMRRSEPRYGLPFSMTYHLFYANPALLAEAGLDDQAPRSVADLVARAVQADRRLSTRHDSWHGLVTASLTDYLILAGALQAEPGRVIYVESRAREVLQAFAGSMVTCANSSDVPDWFEAGRLAYMLHCSFMMPTLQAQPMPLPLADDLRIHAHLNVLAIGRDCRYPQDILALMQHLLSEPVQTELGRQHANAPVRAAAALAPAVLADHPLGADAYRSVLDHSSLLWSEADLHTLDGCCYVDPWLNKGDISVAAALGRLRFSLELAFGERLQVVETDAG